MQIKPIKLVECLVLVVFLVGHYDCVNPADNQNDYNIITAITASYNKLIRPSAQITISIKMALKQITAIDEKNQIMTSDAYFSAQWTDSRLMWDPTNVLYGGNTNVLVTATNLWMPDFYQINSVNTNGYVSLSTSNLALVASDGTVYVVFYLAQSRTRCQLSIKYFPFDTQSCSIAIGSWMMDTTIVDFTSDDSLLDTSGYVKNSVWDLMSTNVRSVISSDRYFNFDEDIQNEDIYFDFVLARRPLYFMMNNIFPCLILNFVVILLFSLPFNAQVGSCKH